MRNVIQEPKFWIGLAVGVFAGLSWGYALLLGSRWWLPFYEWQSLTAGVFALIAAVIAYFAVRIQIEATKALETQAQKERDDRALAILLAELSVEALELYTLHAKMLNGTEAFDEDLLKARFYKILKYPPKMSKLLDIKNIMSLGSCLGDYGHSNFQEAQRVLLIRSNRGDLTILNIEIPNAIFQWANRGLRASDNDLENTLERNRTAQWEPKKH